MCLVMVAMCIHLDSVTSALLRVQSALVEETIQPDSCADLKVHCIITLNIRQSEELTPF